MRHPTPDEATLPSRLRNNEYINISYHRPVTCDQGDISDGKFVRDAAFDWKVVFLRSTQMGLVQHRASVIKVRHPNSFWLVIMLIDPPLKNTFYVSGHKDDESHKAHLLLRPFLGHYENFADLPKFSDNWTSLAKQSGGGMFDDVIDHWKDSAPTCFDRTDPTIQSLAYYPLRIVAAEWVKYVEVMHACIKRFEYQGNKLPELSAFNMHISELQSWRRRSIRSQEKIQGIIRKLQTHISPDTTHQAAINDLVEDLELTNKNIKIAGKRLENMLPVVTSLVQIIDARQSFAETANISRLTVLALVFVPLSYISSLFSMNPTNSPGSSHFWVYFAVAIPVTLMVFCVARPPAQEVRDGIAWLRSRQKQRRTIHLLRKKLSPQKNLKA